VVQGRGHGGEVAVSDLALWRCGRRCQGRKSNHKPPETVGFAVIMAGVAKLVIIDNAAKPDSRLQDRRLAARWAGVCSGAMMREQGGGEPAALGRPSLGGLMKDAYRLDAWRRQKSRNLKPLRRLVPYVLSHWPDATLGLIFILI